MSRNNIFEFIKKISFNNGCSARNKALPLVAMGVFVGISAPSFADNGNDGNKPPPELKALQRQLQQMQQQINELKTKQGNRNDETLGPRVDSVEESVVSLEDRVGDRAVIHAFEGIKVDIGGFFHSAYTHIDADDGSAESFDRQNFELLIATQISEDWSGFFAGGFLRQSGDPFGASTGGSRTNPKFNSVGENPLIIGWTNYRYNDAFNVRIGRMITPHGVINIEHFPAALLDPEQPQLLRPFSGDTLFPNFSTGIQVHGSSFINGGVINALDYAVYDSSAATNSEAHNGGTRIGLRLLDDHAKIGLNYSSGERDDQLTRYDLWGADLRFDFGRFLLDSEVFETHGDIEGHRLGAYVQPAWQLSSQWIAFYRYDYLDTGESVGTTIENVVGLNYLPRPNVRLRTIYTHREYDAGFVGGIETLPEADVDIVQISGTFSF